MNLRHATLHQLRIFLAVARHNSFARAAEELHLSPPTLSLQVKQLSETVGQPLFEQLGKKIFLTATGQTLADACADIETRMERLSQDLAALQGVERGSLKLAILTTVKYTVPKLLGGFCAAHPGIEVAMLVGNRENLLQRLAANQDDLYIMGQPPESMDVVSENFADNPLVLVAPPDHPLVGKKKIAPNRLKNEPFILREPGSGTRLTAEKFFASQGVTLKNRLEVGSNEAIKQTVAGGLGLAVLSATTVVSELALGELVLLDVVGFPLIRRWHVVYPRGKRLSAAALAFKEWLFEHRPVSPAQPPAS
ncbi:MAG TPA: LysR family transcriptional regulator [Hydrogenophaga sp.]|jgi:DNA-binding transcriptional LysR family regulator|uniref:LysR family transcriptional regulator n=1 Tax=Hydrogenophaga sp. TaxID=1904254 RepID=UPI0008C0942F|nr:LysR family transcriptional regulator [Hydrogenophaga sp.]OGA76983.1 MAG: LysR family transcriptional regulator [Burkholderiales bacterium GWE1_65_30]OGA90444.1 MAG: LysR family transcriptional regulator [Burkholderiales bacterium GWF1_66_17]PKO75532.1 MAG: LysR family transcriptional regulator [Betaproteobacteria bacterium HGW-Betaproteobacteria-15]HAX18927.1 LysR family transcriptional regulator [Hydrogenophaga sp.]HBU21006.1 LysR family transcriptional regulator [Hydrogenophaga sp.]